MILRASLIFALTSAFSIVLHLHTLIAFYAAGVGVCALDPDLLMYASRQTTAERGPAWLAVPIAFCAALLWPLGIAVRMWKVIRG